MADERDLEAHPHLAERLRGVRDVFSREAPAAPTEVTRQQAMPDHLGGQAVSDTFIRGGQTPPPPPSAPPREKGLPSHLKSRLAEVSDELRRAEGETDPIEAYRAIRRRLGGA